eukprot:2174025-Prymnesium_polylepis.1
MCVHGQGHGRSSKIVRGRHVGRCRMSCVWVPSIPVALVGPHSSMLDDVRLSYAGRVLRVVCAELLVDFPPQLRRVEFGVQIRSIPKRKLGTECRRLADKYCSPSPGEHITSHVESPFGDSRPRCPSQ